MDFVILILLWNNKSREKWFYKMGMEFSLWNIRNKNKSCGWDGVVIIIFLLWQKCSVTWWWGRLRERLDRGKKRAQLCFYCASNFSVKFVMLCTMIVVNISIMHVVVCGKAIFFCWKFHHITLSFVRIVGSEYNTESFELLSRSLWFTFPSKSPNKIVHVLWLMQKLCKLHLK